VASVETATIRQVLNGDPSAFRILMVGHFRAVFRTVYRIVGNEADAEDITQEAFLRAYTNLNQFRQDAKFSTWVTRIAINLAFNAVERRNRDALFQASSGDINDNALLMELVDQAPQADELVFAGEAARLRETTMQELTAMERTAVALWFVEEVPLDEIGTTLGIPKNSVKQAVFRGVGKLRKALAPLKGGMR
jgi:RNA polymerase sigma-70 factor (ECF subfamily)